MTKKKLLQVPVDESLYRWIVSSKKEMKIKKDAEFTRVVFTYLKDTDISDLKTKIEKTRISAMLQEAERKEEEASKEKANLSKQLAKLEA